MKIRINADDLGISSQVNKAIILLMSNGLVDTASLIIKSDLFNLTLRDILDNGLEKRVGLHLNLIEGKPLTKEITNLPRFCDSSGYFIKLKKRTLKSFIPLTLKEKDALNHEIEAQINKMTSSGLKVQHIDSHSHTHYDFHLLKQVIHIAKKNNINRIRIIRNVIPSNQKHLFKDAYRILANLYIMSNFPNTTENYFGSMFDYVNSKKRFKNKHQIEIMVHPVLTKKGFIIDKIDSETNEQMCFEKMLNITMNRLNSQ